MKNSSRQLDQAVLERFEAALISVAPGFDGWFVPGLGDEEIDQLTTSLPGVLPEEGRALWQWHNGESVVGPGERPQELPFGIGSGEFMFSSLEDAVRRYHSFSEQVLSDTDDPELVEARRWFPIDVVGRCSIVLSDVERSFTPVLASDPIHFEFGRQFASSLGEFVLMWTEALETGSLYLEAGSWNVHVDQLPELLRDSELA